MMNLGVFGLVMGLEEKWGAKTGIEDYNGLGFKQPILGFCMVIFMLSLTGIPPLAGFMAKFYLFSYALKNGYIWLTVIALINSVISAYYYLRVLIHLYMVADDPKSSVKTL